MKRLVFLFVLLLSLPAFAEGMKYYPDPVYKKLNTEDPHPMDDMRGMADGGDVRAQFILGDLYTKGKGGLPKDAALGKKWFELSAMHGYVHAFIRLAAIAKHEGKPVDAWQWYELARESDEEAEPEKEFAKQQRDALNLKEDEIKAARKGIRAWEEKRDETLKAEAEKEKEEPKEEKEEEKKHVED